MPSKRRSDAHLARTAQSHDKHAHVVPSTRHVANGKGSTNSPGTVSRLTRNRDTGAPSGLRDVKPK